MSTTRNIQCVQIVQYFIKFLISLAKLYSQATPKNKSRIDKV